MNPYDEKACDACDKVVPENELDAHNLCEECTEEVPDDY